MIRYVIAAGFLCLIALSFIGCSTSGNNSPIIGNLAGENPRDGVVQTSDSYMLGYWDVSLGPATGLAVLVQLRSADITLNVVKSLQPPDAIENQIEVFINDDTQWAAGLVDVNVTLHHPFPSYDLFTGFDVKGVIVGNGSNTSAQDPSIHYAGANDLQVLNADGYTRWYNPSEFTSYGSLTGFTLSKSATQSYDWTATINAYKTFCDGLDAVSDPYYFFDPPEYCPNPRAYFAPHSTLMRQYWIQFPLDAGEPQYNFQIACVASWAMSDPNPPVNIPDDFPPGANCKEAYVAHAEDHSDMYYVDNTDKGGDLIVTLRAYDHQGEFNPLGVAGEISEINIESPDGLINGGYVSYTGAVLESALVSQDNLDASYQFILSDLNLTAPGFYPVLITVVGKDTDSYFNGDPDNNFPQGAKLCTYQIAWVEVKSYSLPDQPPVAYAEVISMPPYDPATPITLSGLGSFDPDGGVIISYEWDFDNDGAYGDAYDSGSDSEPVIHFDTEGIYPVGLKVTDDESDTGTLFVPLEINVGASDYAPFAFASVITYPPYNAGNDIEFDASSSIDPDGGNIILYEWDFDGDGTYGDTYDSGTDVMPVKIFADPGTYNVDLRVTDDENATDTLDYALVVDVGSDSLPPIADAKLVTYSPYHVGTPIELDAAFSYDPDGGSIVSYEWDFDGDGTYGDVYDSGTPANPVIHFDTLGLKEIDLKVTDNENATDTLDSLISIDVVDATESGWARNLGGPGWDYGHCIAVDPDGNSFLAGVFEQTADFDPGPGEALFTAGEFSWDMFLVKLDAQGNYQWAYTWGSEWGDEEPYGLACDQDGNVFMSGTFDDTIDFDPGPGVEDHQAYGTPDGFVIKFASNGTYLWTRTWGGSAVTVVSAECDNLGNVYMTGTYYGAVDFNPNPGTDVHTSGYWDDAFVMVLHGDGSYAWTQAFGGEEPDIAYGVGIDGSGNVYATGSYSATVDFDPGPGLDEHTVIGSSDIFLVKYDNTGAYQWSRVWGSDGGPYDVAYGVSANASGVVAVTGYFFGTADFDPGVGVDEKTSTNYVDTFVSVFDANGDYQWASHWGGADESYPESHVVVTDDNVIRVAGQFIGLFDFDPGPGVENHDGVEMDAFLTNYDASGNYLWTHTFGGGYVDWGEGVDVDGAGNIYVGGTFFDLADFEPGPGSDNHYSNGGSDGYILKLLPDGSW